MNESATPLAEVELQHDSTPSWKKHVDQGWATLKVTHHTETRWTLLITRESYNHEGKHAYRETFFTVAPEERKAFLAAVAPEHAELLAALKKLAIHAAYCKGDGSNCEACAAIAKAEVR